MPSPTIYPEPRPPVEANKRKANEQASESSRGKRRAARACVSCRSRKVRCDVTAGGSPCTNCRLDSIACLLTESTRNRVQSSVDGEENRPVSDQYPVDDFPMSLTFEGSQRAARSAEHPVAADNLSQSSRSAFISPVTAAPHTSPLAKDHQSQRLPSYIRLLPAHITRDDIDYLAKKGALTLPDEELQCALLRVYIQYVHNFMPILDLSSFLQPIAQMDETTEPVSLLLFQAVMAMSVTFVDLEYLINRGYESRRSARKIFFDRARLLYALECETDRVSLLQALLLMTYWYAKPEDEKETWYWLGIALSLAQVLGIHRDPTLLNIDPLAKRLRKRLWWSCFMRDRLLALGIRRPVRIRADDFSVPMLTLEDYEETPWSNSVSRFLGPMPMLDDAAAKRNMSFISIELAKLCVHIGTLLLTQYSILGNASPADEDALITMVIAKKSPEQASEMTNCDHSLGEWYQALNSAYQYKTGQDFLLVEHPECRRIVRLYLSLLHMIYFTAVTVLHRPRALRLTPGSSELTSIGVSRDKVTEAAVAITEIVYELSYHDLLRYASTNSITALLSATMIHLTDIRSAREDVRNSAIGRFYQCWQALQQLRNMYSSADYAVWFVETVIHKTKLQIPMLMTAARPLDSFTQRSDSSMHDSGNLTSTLLDKQTATLSNGIDPPGLSGGNTSRFSSQSTDTIVVNNGGYSTNSAGQRLLGVAPHFGQASSPLANMHFEVSSADPVAGTRNGFEMEDNLLQALINFDANPNSWATVEYERFSAP